MRIHPSTCLHCGTIFRGPDNRVRLYCSTTCADAHKKRPPEERFWEKVDRSGGALACWLWLAGVFQSGDGYGAFTVTTGLVVRAHRYAWELLCGPIPPGMEVCHNCPTGDNPRCVNPAHMFLGTQTDNMRDMREKGRQGKPNPVMGTRHHNAKLDPDAVRAIRVALAAGEAKTVIARRHGVDPATIANIERGRIWAHVA